MPYHMCSAALSTVSGRSRRSHSQMLGKKILNYSPKGRFRAAAGPKARLKRFIKEVGRQMCPNHGVTIWSLTLKQGTWPPWNERRGWKSFKPALLQQGGSCREEDAVKKRGYFFPQLGIFLCATFGSAKRGQPKPSHHCLAFPKAVHRAVRMLGATRFKKKKIKIWGK